VAALLSAQTVALLEQLAEVEHAELLRRLALDRAQRAGL
jgi:hypothetical protein